MTTAEQFKAILDELQALRGFIEAKLKWDNPLVGDGVPRPKAPTSAEVAMDPQAYYGTPFDPLPSDLRISNTVVIRRFESAPFDENNPDPNRFVGGTIGEWYRRDPDAALRFLADTLQGHQININSLHPTQRKILFG